MSTIKIVTWNVNGIRSCLKNGMIGSLSEIDADIVCLQETRAKPEQIKLDLTGYERYWNPAKKAGYSGTTIFARRHPLSVTNELPYPGLSDEGRLITAEFDDFFLVNCYSPTSGSDFIRLLFRERWDLCLCNYVCSLIDKKPVIICGDLNVVSTEQDIYPFPPQGHYFPGFTPIERGAFSRLLHLGFLDAFRYLYPQVSTFTWQDPRIRAKSKDIGIRLDYFIVSDSLKERIVDVEILQDIQGSDHYPVVLTLKQ